MTGSEKVLERDLPETRWLRMSDGTHLACQLVGDAPHTVLLMGMLADVETGWQVPLIATIRSRIASFSRLLLYDERGDGRSDPVPSSAMPDVDVRVADLLAVLDALGIPEVAIIADTDGGTVALTFAARYPGRVTSLVLSGAYARLAYADDHKIGWQPDEIAGLLDATQKTWGTGMLAHAYVPSLASRDEDVVAAFARLERRSISPGQVLAFLRRSFATDVRPLLAHVQAPTLVVHRHRDPFINIEHGRHLAASIPGALLLELDGHDRLLGVGDGDQGLGEIERFLTGAVAPPPSHRVVRTVMFVDIVGSTERLGAMGDTDFAHLLDDFEGMARRQVSRFDGETVKTTGDGFVALFHRPVSAVDAALMIREGARRQEIEIRVGLHLGEIEVRSADIAGMTVHVAARVQAKAAPGTIVVSTSVLDMMAASDADFDDLGEHTLKGVDGIWRLYALLP
jgi:class 3 adenylate cyclase